MRDISKSLHTAVSDTHYIGRWYNNKENWGDAINPVLIEKLFGKKIIHQNEVYNIANKPIYSLVGSIINVFNTNKKVRIWGSGVAAPEKKLGYIPEKIYAVRGPKTQDYLKENGIKSQHIFGDPVLLIDRIYNPEKKQKKFKLGIIKHYEDITPELDALVNRNSEIKYIHIIRDLTNPFSIIDEILECENIISSSLHGLILADVYKVPNVWVCFKNFEKNTYKYLDYYESIKSKRSHFTLINNSNINNLDNLSFDIQNINLDLEALFQSNPFH